MKFKLVEKFNLSEDVFFHKAYRDKNGNVVDDQGIPVDPKITPDLAKRFSPFWDKADDDIIDPSEYSPFTDGVYPDWAGENDSNGGKGGNANGKGKQGNEESDSEDANKDGNAKGEGGQGKDGDKEGNSNDTTKDGNGNNSAEVDGQEKEKREYSNNSTNNQGSGTGGGGGNSSSNSSNSGGKGGNGDPKNKNQQDENENEDRRIFIDTSTGKRYKKVNDKYVEI